MAIFSFACKGPQPNIQNHMEIDKIYVGDESYNANSIPEKIAMEDGKTLTLSVIYKKDVAKDKEKIRFTVDNATPQEIAVTGRRVDATFASIMNGTHTVKIEQLVGSNFGTVNKTFNFTVEYEAAKQKVEFRTLRCLAKMIKIQLRLRKVDRGLKIDQLQNWKRQMKQTYMNI